MVLRSVNFHDPPLRFRRVVGGIQNSYAVANAKTLPSGTNVSKAVNHLPIFSHELKFGDRNRPGVRKRRMNPVSKYRGRSCLPMPDLPIGTTE